MVETVCFIPCSSCKNSGDGAEIPPYAWPGSDLEGAWARLGVARRGMEYCIEDGSKRTPAIHLYSGTFYSAFDAGLARQLIYSGKLRLFIISAAYGVLDAYEPVYKHEARLEGRVAIHWRDAGLAEVIRDICLSLSPKRVYGFFSGEASWSSSGTKYRYFFNEGIKKALLTGLKPDRAGCFYREGGVGSTAILRALGHALSNGFSNGLNYERIIEVAKAKGLRDGAVFIGYEDLAVGKCEKHDKT